MTDTEAPRTGTVVIRPRLKSDLPEAGKALVSVHQTDGYPVEGVEDPEAWLSPDQLTEAWIAELDGQVVGHVLLSRPDGEDAIALFRQRWPEDDAGILVLGRLFVLREARGKSVGEKLVRAATESAHAQNHHAVLDVMAKDAAAIRLYERLGWQLIGSASHSYGDGQQIEALCYAAPMKRAS
ncbi:GNAT family N-acetyltransferase [Streptomyces sp. ST2-7A]|uniref:GNAT family N-acetyltransferase n=1 Tax=Streptomyces sp. ST2-7A TaxID=2907214 RepID=UPI001F2DEAC1|nr:GNAT family N-acetyltransferase [Streptomyces sp. ST2-7A]MCE7079980.1 GNAT family N-acetyltransferase [Streptomyces sp. ST2-7A]